MPHDWELGEGEGRCTYLRIVSARGGLGCDDCQGVTSAGAVGKMLEVTSLSEAE